MVVLRALDIISPLQPPPLHQTTDPARDPTAGIVISVCLLFTFCAKLRVYKFYA